MVGRLPKSRLAGYGKRGKIRINPRARGRVDGKNIRSALVRHERVERGLRREGLTYPQAHRKALDKEMEGMTLKEKLSYSGRLGAIARWHPHRG